MLAWMTETPGSERRLPCRRLRPQWLTLVALAAIAAAPQVSVASVSERLPNIVFVIADDLGYGDLGCFGSTKIPTPHLDALAERGLRLTAHYAGNAVCAPSRCVLMTGLHPGHAEIRSNREIQPEGQWPLASQTLTLAERLQAVGYTCGAFGKWGLGGPNTVGQPLAQGFDRFYGYNCQRVAHNFYPISLWSDDDVVPLRNRSFSPYAVLPSTADRNDPATYEQYRDVDYSADLIAEQAVAFVHENAERPFFLFHPSTIPHLALQAPQEEVDRHDFADDAPYPGGRGYLPSHRPRATYAAMVSRLDGHVGQLVAALDEHDLLESTLIVFTSDNGPLYDRLGGTDSEFFNSHGGLRGRKGSLYEGGVRVPTIVAGPGIASGESEHRSGFEDWTPTLLSLIGQPSQNLDDGHGRPLDGEDFSRVLRGEPQPPRGPLYREFPGYGGQQAVWEGQWKAYRGELLKAGRGASPQPPAWELYDVTSDRGESRNVASDYPEVVQRVDAFARRQHTPSSLFPIPVLDADVGGRNSAGE